MEAAATRPASLREESEPLSVRISKLLSSEAPVSDSMNGRFCSTNQQQTEYRVEVLTTETKTWLSRQYLFHILFRHDMYIISIK